MVIAAALVIGVADYALIGALPQAVGHDVDDIVNVLCNPAAIGLPPHMVTRLVDAEANADAIRAAFDDFSARLPEDATFLFYFSGHGERTRDGSGEQSWLLPHDVDPSRLADTALSSTEIRRRLAGIAAERQVLMIDACHAGGIGSAKCTGGYTPKGFGRSGIDALAQGAGLALLTSSRADEVSIILRGERNSVFTTALLEALGGEAHDRGDGVIGVFDVFEYVSSTVPLRVDQHPIFHASDLDSNFALARRSFTPPARTMATDQLVELFSKLYPAGPLQDAIWARAGGDLSRLLLTGSGVAQWHSAITKMNLGGGGLVLDELIQAALADYPSHPQLIALAD
tara:strand:- start:26200 stop:27225 length:1026 start_codon:yes stop_codon:yes gene_type:complete